jgi:hypothetical protein
MEALQRARNIGHRSRERKSSFYVSFEFWRADHAGATENDPLNLQSPPPTLNDSTEGPSRN